MADKPGVLRNLRIKRVSLVEQGANFDPDTRDGAHIMLYKSAASKSDSLSSVHVDTAGEDDRDEYEKATLDAEGRNKLPDSAFAAVWTDDKGRKRRKLPIHDAGHLAAAQGRVDESDIPANVKAEARRKIDAATNKEKPVKKNFFKSLLDAIREPDAEKRVAAVAELEKAFPDSLKDDGPKHDADDEMCKCADCMDKRKSVAKSAEVVALEKKFESIEKSNAELAKSNKALSEALEIEKGIRADNEMRTVLKSFRATPFKLEGDDNDVTRFRKMKDSDPKTYERTMEILKAADVAAASSMAFNSMGTSRTGTGSAYDQLVAKAKSVVEKSSKADEMTFEKAFDRICEEPENVKLVAQYRQEQN